MGGKIQRHSTVESKLPEKVRKQVDRLLIEGATYSEAAAFVQGKGYEISRSAIGRYGKRFLETYRELRIVEDQARALVSEAGDGLILDESLAKLLTAAALKQAQGNLDLKELTRLMHAAANLQTSGVQRERAKAQFKEKAEKKAKKVAEEVAREAKRGGLSDQTADKIKAKILGITNV